MFIIRVDLIIFLGMTTFNNNLSKLYHSLMVAFVALSLGLSANVNGRGLNPLLSRRRHLLINIDAEPALDRPLHERDTYSHQNNEAATYYDRAEQMDRLALLLAHMMRNSHMSESIRGKRAKRVETMDDLVRAYTTFYDTLDVFLNSYTSRLKPAYSESALKDITAILQLLPKNSYYISTGNVEKVKQGINQTLQMTEYLMHSGSSFLQQSSQSWFDGQRPYFTLLIGSMYANLACVINVGDSQQVQEEQSGIGGGNTSKTGELSASTLETIKKIAVILTQGQ